MLFGSIYGKESERESETEVAALRSALLFNLHISEQTQSLLSVQAVAVYLLRKYV